MTAPPNDLAGRSTRARRTPADSHPGQFMTRLHPPYGFEFHHNPLRLGPLRHILNPAWQASGSPQAIASSRSTGMDVILPSDVLTRRLVAASGRLGRGSLQA